MKKIPDVVKEPIFLKFVEHYAKKFREQNGFGRWLYEYQDMEQKGLFSPRILRSFYIQICTDKFDLGFIRDEAVWHICSQAVDAANNYIDERVNSLYNIVLITGEIAEDEDGDAYSELTYEEANEICQALNEEAEEELFKIKKI